jgi:hypothetical protein
MTLVLSVQATNAIFMVADCRLSAPGRKPFDSACKMMVLETSDGVALLGYAGLGSTAVGTQPSTWMSRVIRGVDVPLERALSVLAGAMENEMPRHLKQVPGMPHIVLAPALVGSDIRLYSIDISVARGKTSLSLRRLSGGQYFRGRPRKVAFIGSGAMPLAAHKARLRELNRGLRAFEDGKIKAETLADSLAEINLEISKVDQLVGPNCIVMWRFSRGNNHPGGGGHQSYRGINRVNSLAVPTIGRGLDVQAISNALMPIVKSHAARVFKGETAPMDEAALKEALSKLPSTPDPRLR